MFFLFLVIFKTFFIIIPVARENTRVKPALAIPLIPLAKEIIDTYPLAADNTIKVLSI